MPVVLYRIDNRLIHGQVLEAWVPRLGAGALAVIDRRIAGDEFEKSILESMGQGLLEVTVAGPEEAAGVVASRSAGTKLIVLFKTLDQAVEAMDAGLAIDKLNLGNIHPRQGSRPLTDSVHVTREDVDLLARLARAGVEIEARAVPADVGPDLRDLSRLEQGQ